MRKNYLYAVLVIFTALAIIPMQVDAKSSHSNETYVVTENDKLYIQCLKDKGVEMFGLSTCPHCKAQKRVFGEYFDQVNYVNCDRPVGRCLEASRKGRGYPTWLDPEGKVIEPGSIEELALDAGCNLNEIKAQTTGSSASMEVSNSSPVIVEELESLEKTIPSQEDIIGSWKLVKSIQKVSLKDGDPYGFENQIRIFYEDNYAKHVSSNKAIALDDPIIASAPKTSQFSINDKGKLRINKIGLSPENIQSFIIQSQLNSAGIKEGDLELVWYYKDEPALIHIFRKVSDVQ
ncbi:MAG TPA: hypothetical protein V6C96_02530 [Vampirovibrionales bacterium]